MPLLLKTKNGKRLRKEKKQVVIDFTCKDFKRFDQSVISKINKAKDQILIIDYVYPLATLSKKSYSISDHVNLSGENPLKGPIFIPLANVYNSKKGIKVAGLLEGTYPNEKEKKILLKNDIKAYCYNTVPTVIFSVSKGLKAKVIGKVRYTAE